MSFTEEAATRLFNVRRGRLLRSSMRLQNTTRKCLVAEDVLEARTFWERGAGLLALPPLQSGQALWLEPCGSIHTWGMRYAIDVVFLDRGLRVLAVWRAVRPWRIAWAPRGTQVAVELSSGAAKNVQRGDVLHRIAD